MTEEQTTAEPVTEPKVIERLYAYVTTGDDGDEGVTSVQIGDMHYPMVGADMERMRSLQAYATSIARITRRDVRLVEFTGVRVVNKISPPPPPKRRKGGH